ncbi:MAG TPA: hypothetical protein VF055_01510 [Steroidobacteraceae bacterium]
MDYEVTWEGSFGFYARFTGWVTPKSAASVALALTSDPRYDDLRYAIIDLTAAPGHTFRRDDQNAIANAMVQQIGAGMANRNIVEIAIATDPRMLNFLQTYASLTTRPFYIFDSLAAARRWLAEQTGTFRRLVEP